MKVIAVNVCPDGSTGHIMRNIANTARNCNIEFKTVSAYKNVAVNSEHIYMGNRLGRRLSIVLGKLIGNEFALSIFSTQKLIHLLKREKPDIIHFHNLHAYYLNLPMLIKYINKKELPVVWTLHDCWSFTGHCPHFVMKKCEKWKSECYECPAYREYPVSLFDRSRSKFRQKKKMFCSIKKLTLVTPSEWLAGMVKQSFLKGYEVKVINNGINLDVFKPTESNLRNELGLEDKYVILGVASPWSEKKGLDVFIELAKRLDDSYRIVLVGLNDEQIRNLPENIIGIKRTSNQIELAGYYTMADVFVNPTREDTFPTVNIEALACGTPVVTFDTGGSPETIDENCGIVAQCDDTYALEKEIRRECEDKPFLKEACIKRAENFNMNDKFLEYVELYKESL